MRRAALLLGGALVLGAAAPIAAQRGEAEEGAMTEAEARISTSLADLRRVTAVPGEPVRAWWRREPVVVAEGFPPGPTDYRLTAVVEYATAAEVEALLDGSRDFEARLPAPDWLPAPLAEAARGGEIAVRGHARVAGVPIGEVASVPGVPRFLILTGITT